ncbi:MAG: acyl-CoA thioesterase [Pseudomonadales bacterium]
MSDNFRFILRVRYSECDAQNVVFNARYADYVDHAATEFQRYIVGGYSALVEQNLENQVVKLVIEWQSAARFDDVLAIDVSVRHIGNTSYIFDIVITDFPSERPVARAEVVYVLVTADKLEKTPVPDEMRASMLKGAAGVVVDQSGGALSA